MIKETILDNLRIFGLGCSGNYTDKICEFLSIKRTAHREEWQDDDEPYLL